MLRNVRRNSANLCGGAFFEVIDSQLVVYQKSEVSLQSNTVPITIIYDYDSPRRVYTMDLSHIY